MHLTVLAGSLMLSAVIVSTSTAQAFWERSPLMKCVEAQTEAEWLRRQCGLIEPSGPFSGVRIERDERSDRSLHQPLDRQGRRPAVRRLG